MLACSRRNRANRISNFSRKRASWGRTGRILFEGIFLAAYGRTDRRSHFNGYSIRDTVCKKQKRRSAGQRRLFRPCWTFAAGYQRPECNSY